MYVAVTVEMSSKVSGTELGLIVSVALVTQKSLVVTAKCLESLQSQFTVNEEGPLLL